MTKFLLDPLTEDEVNRLNELKSEHPKEFKRLVKVFEKQARAYRDRQPTIYSIGLLFSDDTYVLASNFYLKNLTKYDVEKFFETV